MTGETRILLSLISRREHIVNLPHDPLGPLNRSRDHGLRPRARAVGEEVFSGLEMPSDENPPCRARAWVHNRTCSHVNRGSLRRAGDRGAVYSASMKSQWGRDTVKIDSNRVTIGSSRLSPQPKEAPANESTASEQLEPSSYTELSDTRAIAPRNPSLMPSAASIT